MNIAKTLSSLFLIGAAVVALVGFTPTPPAKADFCTLAQMRTLQSQGHFTANPISTNNGFHVGNDSDCAFQLTIASFKMVGTQGNQFQYDLKHVVAVPRSNTTFLVNVPADCGYQLDIWYGLFEPAAGNGQPVNWAAWTPDWAANGIGGFMFGQPCQLPTPTPTPTATPTPTPTMTPTPTVTPTPTPTPQACTSPLSLAEVRTLIAQGKITVSSSANNGFIVKNKTNCSFPVTLLTFKLLDNMSNLHVSSLNVDTMPANTTKVFVGAIPNSCSYRMDLHYGSSQPAQVGQTIDLNSYSQAYASVMLGGFTSDNQGMCPTPTPAPSQSLTSKIINIINLPASNPAPAFVIPSINVQNDNKVETGDVHVDTGEVNVETGDQNVTIKR